MGRKAVPDRWLQYKPLGKRINGTQFIAFKVPLSQKFNGHLDSEERFSSENLLENCPNLSLVVDLTNTNRYYNKREFTTNNVYYEKIYCPGHEIPDFSNVEKFFNVVDSFLKQAKPDDLIGVHCTHGVNRTGYFICRYMIQRLGVDPSVAMSDFAAARGYPIERQNYIQDLESKMMDIPPLNPDQVTNFVYDTPDELVVDEKPSRDGYRNRRGRWEEVIESRTDDRNISYGRQRSFDQDRYRESDRIPPSSSNYQNYRSPRPAPYGRPHFNRRGYGFRDYGQYSERDYRNQNANRESYEQQQSRFPSDRNRYKWSRRDNRETPVTNEHDTH